MIQIRDNRINAENKMPKIESVEFIEDSKRRKPALAIVEELPQEEDYKLEISEESY